MSSSKRLASDELSEASSSKKPALASVFAPRNQPLPPLSNNKLIFPTRISDTVVLSTWNVNGLVNAASKAKDYAFRKYIEAEDPDLIVLTETYVTEQKARNEPSLEFLKLRYKGLYWSKKVAILSRTVPLKVTYGLPDWAESDSEEARERCITLEFPSVIVIGAYVQNSSSDQQFMHKRLAWERDLLAYIPSLQTGTRPALQKSIIFLGDFNVLPKKEDVSRPDMVWDKFPGTLIDERVAQAKLLEDLNLVDVWRLLHPKSREYTHSTKRYGGMRLDGFIVTRQFLLRIRTCEIRHEVNELYESCSDHWPISLVCEGSL